MASELDKRIISEFVQVITRKLDEAAIIARTANGISEQGLPERALRTLLDVEPLIHDSTALLNATSVWGRRDREIVLDPD